MKQALILSLVLPLTNNAHNPHLVTSDKIIVINPQISQAFYATHPGSYIIENEQPFTLYVQLLRPKIGNLNNDIKATIWQNDKILTTLDGQQTPNWKIFHEHFTNNDYYQGPEITIQTQGHLEINVQGDNKYVLVIGKKEHWPLSEILRTAYLLPMIKIYFGQSPYLAYWNLSGVLLSIMLLIAFIIIWLIFRIVKTFLHQLHK